MTPHEKAQTGKGREVELQVVRRLAGASRRAGSIVAVMTCRYNAICALFDFHSTVVMNAITHDAAISLYPYETFIRKRNLVIDPWEYGDDHTSRQEAAVMKYAARGWRMIKDVDIIEGLN
ncbi:hypothetical protein K525DRAFT_251626, partial [Schizophyllum commune Loenen D]